MTAILVVVEEDRVLAAADRQGTSCDIPSMISKFVHRYGWTFIWAGSSSVGSWLSYEWSLPLPLSPGECVKPISDYLTPEDLADEGAIAYSISVKYGIWKRQIDIDANLVAISPKGRVFEVYAGSIEEAHPGAIVAYGQPLAVTAAYYALSGLIPEKEVVRRVIDSVSKASIYCGGGVDYQEFTRENQ